MPASLRSDRRIENSGRLRLCAACHLPRADDDPTLTSSDLSPERGRVAADSPDASAPSSPSTVSRRESQQSVLNGLAACLAQSSCATFQLSVAKLHRPVQSEGGSRLHEPVASRRAECTRPRTTDACRLDPRGLRERRRSRQSCFSCLLLVSLPSCGSSSLPSVLGGRLLANLIVLTLLFLQQQVRTPTTPCRPKMPSRFFPCQTTSHRGWKTFFTAVPANQTVSSRDAVRRSHLRGKTGRGTDSPRVRPVGP